MEEVNSCNNSSIIYNEEELNFTADEYLNHEKIITRNFSINSTMSCPSDNNISRMLINVTIFYSALQKFWGDITPKMGALHPTSQSLQWSEAPKE